MGGVAHLMKWMGGFGWGRSIVLERTSSPCGGWSQERPGVCVSLAAPCRPVHGTRWVRLNGVVGVGLVGAHATTVLWKYLPTNARRGASFVARNLGHPPGQPPLFGSGNTEQECKFVCLLVYFVFLFRPPPGGGTGRALLPPPPPVLLPFLLSTTATYMYTRKKQKSRESIRSNVGQPIRGKRRDRCCVQNERFDPKKTVHWCVPPFPQARTRLKRSAWRCPRSASATPAWSAKKSSFRPESAAGPPLLAW